MRTAWIPLVVLDLPSSADIFNKTNYPGPGPYLVPTGIVLWPAGTAEHGDVYPTAINFGDWRALVREQAIEGEKDHEDGVHFARAATLNIATRGTEFDVHRVIDQTREFHVELARVLGRSETKIKAA